MGNALLTSLALLIGANAHAASEEIQVYLDDKEAPGAMSVDWHLNRVTTGRRTPDYAGEQPPGGVDRVTPELNLGLTPTLELGAYALSSRSAQGDWRADGAKVRLKYIAEHDEEHGVYWGANLEVGRESRLTAPVPWNAELKGIVGIYMGPWLAGANLNLDRPISAAAGPTTVDVDFRLSRRLSPETSIGVESYNELGPLRRLAPLNQGSKALFAVVDTQIAGIPIEAGVGRGLTTEADRWTIKMIVTFPTTIR
ncbi:MAG: hypothetical protein JO006_17305 [Paucibacter sp.]|nr:hypothetical protein [Roseateles sp.]